VISSAEVTVVVATRNRRERLAGTLGHHAAPVILVDNGSDDGTPEFVERHFPWVRVVRLDRNAGGAARNIGVQLATTPYVAFADDDSYWADGSLEQAAEVLTDHPGVGLLAARVLVGPQARLDPVSAAMAAAPLGTPPGHAGPAVLGFLACAAVVRREAFLATGGFNSALHTYGEEDLLALDLAAAGWHLSYVPSLVVHHLPSPHGRDNGRRRTQARNRMLTALLRRPWRVVGGTAAELSRDAAGRRGLADAVRMLPWALRHRQPLPAAVERARRRIETASGPAASHAVVESATA
jgi:N-acetylglucosaminyl-diphospho-decaprenol L-rhamnosyltransferase